MNISLHQAHLGDLDEIHRIRRAAILGIESDEFSMSFLRGWAERRVPEYFMPRVSQGLVVLAEVDGVSAGWGSSAKNKIEGVYVDPSAGQSGVGRCLITRLEADIAQRGYGSAELAASLNAVSFYTRLGYVKTRSHSEGDAFHMRR